MGVHHRQRAQDFAPAIRQLKGITLDQFARLWPGRDFDTPSVPVPQRSFDLLYSEKLIEVLSHERSSLGHELFVCYLEQTVSGRDALGLESFLANFRKKLRKVFRWRL